MNKCFDNVTAIFAVAVMVITCIACGQNAGSTETTPASPPSNVSPAAAPVAESAVDISGNYAVNGQNDGGGDEYTGELTVTKRGSVYQFSWQSGDRTYDGVGVQAGTSVGVSFTEGTEGKGCGVVLYQIKPDGSLDGKAGYWGVNEAEAETATRTSGTDLEGTYDVKGSDPQGQRYTGKLAVNKEGVGYRFKWTTSTASLSGFGIRGSQMVAVGIGGDKCGFIGYDVQPDGTLDGKWGLAGSTSVGTETGKKK